MFSAWNKSIWKIPCGLWQNHFIWCDLWKVKKVFLETPDMFEIKILEWSGGIHFNYSTPCLWAARCSVGSWGSRRWRVDERVWGEMRPLSSRSLSSEGAGSWVWAKCYWSKVLQELCQKEGIRTWVRWGRRALPARKLQKWVWKPPVFSTPFFPSLIYVLLFLFFSISFLSFFLFFFLYFSLAAWYGSLTRDQTWTLSSVSTKS